MAENVRVSLRKEKVYGVVVQTGWVYSSLFSSSGFLPASSLGDRLRKAKRAHVVVTESKSFELFTQNSLFLVKLSGFRSTEHHARNKN